MRDLLAIILVVVDESKFEDAFHKKQDLSSRHKIQSKLSVNST